MNTHKPSPRKPNLPALARSGETLSGAVDLHDLSRLAQEHVGPSTPVHWQASVRWHDKLPQVDASRRRQGELWLRLQAQATVRQVCQRCLQPMEVPLEIDRDILFVDTEARAAALDEELEQDVLSLEHPVDLVELVEDELVLALPIVPLHDQCEPPAAGALAPAQEPAATPRPNPFAVLAQLKGGAKGR